MFVCFLRVFTGFYGLKKNMNGKWEVYPTRLYEYGCKLIDCTSLHNAHDYVV